MGEGPGLRTPLGWGASSKPPPPRGKRRGRIDSAERAARHYPSTGGNSDHITRTCRLMIGRTTRVTSAVRRIRPPSACGRGEGL